MNEGLTRSTLSSPYRSDISAIWPSSQPYCIFRNHSRAASHNSAESFATNLSSSWHKTKTNHMKMMANRQATTFCQLYPDCFIPFGLVKETVESDVVHLFSESQKPIKTNTIASFTTGSTPYIVHCGGEYMDELVVRNGNFLLPQYCYPTQPSFSINLTNGSVIRQVITAGRAKYGTVANILATGCSELYYLQAIELDEGNLASDKKLVGTCILEPKGKWILPEEISDIGSLLPASNLFSPYTSSAVLISQSGQIFTWNPVRGVQDHSRVTFAVSNPLIACSLSPTSVYIANDKVVYDYDLRSRQSSGSLYHADAKVSAIQSHVTIPQQYTIATETSLLFLDRRYSRNYLFKQQLPHRYDFLCSRKMLSHQRETARTRSIDLLLGANRSSMSNLYLHYFHDRSLSHHLSMPRNSILSPNLQSTLYGRRKYHFSDLFSSFPNHVRNDMYSSDSISLMRMYVKDIPSWRTEAFPVVDTVQRLSGIEMLFLHGNSKYKSRSNRQEKKKTFSSDHASVHTMVSSENSHAQGSRSSTEDSSHDSSDEEEEEGDGVQGVERQKDPPQDFDKYDFTGLIIQQTGRGDVFAQQFTWGDVSFDHQVPPLSVEGGGLIQSAYHSDSSLTVSSTSTLRPLYTFRDTNAFSQEEEEDEEDGSTFSRSGKASPARKNRWMSSLATLDGDDEDDDDEDDEDELGTVAEDRFRSREGSQSNSNKNLQPFSPVRKRPVVSSQASTPSKRSLQKTGAMITASIDATSETALTFARRLPPIVYNGAIGHRFSTTLSTFEASKLLLPLLKQTNLSLDTGDAAVLLQLFQYLQQYFQTTTVISLSSAAKALPALQLTHQQFHSSDLIATDAYPLTSHHFLPYLSQEDQLPSLILQFNLLDLRRDLKSPKSRMRTPKFPQYPILSLPLPVSTDNTINNSDGDNYFIEEEVKEDLNQDDDETKRLLSFLTSLILQQRETWIDYFTIRSEKSLRITRSLAEIWNYFYQLTKRRLEIPLLRKLLLSLTDYSKGKIGFQEDYLTSRSNISREMENSFYSDGLYIVSSADENEKEIYNNEKESLNDAEEQEAEVETNIGPAVKRQKLLLDDSEEESDFLSQRSSSTAASSTPSSSSSSSSASATRKENPPDDLTEDGNDNDKDDNSTIVVEDTSSSEDDEIKSINKAREEEKMNTNDRKGNDSPNSFESNNKPIRQRKGDERETSEPTRSDSSFRSQRINLDLSVNEEYYGCRDCPVPSSQQTIEQCFAIHNCQKRDCRLPHCVVYSLVLPVLSTTSRSRNSPITATTATTAAANKRGRPPKVPQRPLPSTPENRKHTDVTVDLISVLGERWDQSIEGAMPVWPIHRVIDIYREL